MRYPTEVKALDQLFDGYETKVLHLFYGQTGAGKTTLSTYVPIGLIAKAKQGVLAHNEYFYVIDGDGGFDLDRAAQVWSGMGLDPEEIRKHLMYYNPSTFEEQQINIVTLEDVIKKKGHKCLFVGADAMTAIYRGIIIRAPTRDKLLTLSEFTGKLDQQLLALRRLSIIHDCVATASTWPTSSIQASMNLKVETPMIGGRAFGYIPKVIIEVTIPATDRPVREAFLRKHRSKESGDSVMFKLANSGIADLTPQDL
jgi:RecA/RadA recombinase